MRIFLAIASYAGLFTKDGQLRCPAFSHSLADTITLLKARGHHVEFGMREGCCYVQAARNELLKTFLASDCDTLFFLDDDVSWKPEDALRIAEMQDEIVAGVYPFKTVEENYPVVIHTNSDDRAIVREDGCIDAVRVATGFLRIKRSVIEKLIEAYPQQKFSQRNPLGELEDGFYDFFPQGVKNGRWVGEDYAFCQLWTEIGGEIWVVPDLDLSHWRNGEEFKGNYHRFLMRQPGGRDQKWNLTRAMEIHGWMSLLEMEWLAEQASKHQRIIEIGSYLGRSTRAMADNTPGVLIAIDDWQGPRDVKVQEPEKTWDRFSENLKDHLQSGKLTAIRASHDQAAVLITESEWADMVFIDGDHAYESVLRDIRLWKDEMQPGGLLCGHDSNWEGVKRAVSELLPEAQFVPGTSLWFYELPKEARHEGESAIPEGDVVAAG